MGGIVYFGPQLTREDLQCQSGSLVVTLGGGVLYFFGEKSAYFLYKQRDLSSDSQLAEVLKCVF